jgi:hypothetical protein
MPVIDTSTLSPVGEFGSKAWGEGCSEGAIKILEAATLPTDINWAFTEDYTHAPARLMEGGRTHAGYFIMVKDGIVSAGDGIPAESLTLPGFHVQIPWAYICNQSGAHYGREGQQQRSADEGVLMAGIVEYVGRKNPFNYPINQAGNPSGMLDPAGPWPAQVGAALGEGGEEDNGLHNIAATLQTDSPEFADIPVTDLRVPIFAEMTDSQKQDFIKLCGVEM